MPRARARYDAAICMYHDQALIPLEDAGFRGRGQRDAGASDRADVARSRHGVRHRGPRPRRPEQPACRVAAGRAHGAPARGARMSAGDGLPPLREVIAQLGLSARTLARPELSVGFQSDAAHRARGRAACRAHGRRGRARARRPDAGAADGRRGARDRDRAGSALPAGT